jgi:hypothetical protein
MNVDLVSFFLGKKGSQFLEPSFATSCCYYVQHTNSSNLITFHAKLGYAMWSHVQSTCIQSSHDLGLLFCHLHIHPKLKKTKSAKWRIYFRCWKTIRWEYFEHNENKKKQTKTTRGVSHCGLGPVTLKHILRQKKNYGNSNISHAKI